MKFKYVVLSFLFSSIAFAAAEESSSASHRFSFQWTPVKIFFSPAAKVTSYPIDFELGMKVDPSWAIGLGYNFAKYGSSKISTVTISGTYAVNGDIYSTGWIVRPSLLLVDTDVGSSVRGYEYAAAGASTTIGGGYVWNLMNAEQGPTVGALANLIVSNGETFLNFVAPVGWVF